MWDASLLFFCGNRLLLPCVMSSLEHRYESNLLSEIHRSKPIPEADGEFANAGPMSCCAVVGIGAFHSIEM